MKKFFILPKMILVFAVIGISAIGCDLSDNNNEIPNVIEENENSSKEYTASDEILSADIYDNKVQIGDTCLEFPTPLNTLLDMGAETSDNVDYLLETGSIKNINMIYNDFSFTVRVINNDNIDKIAKDCNVYYLICSGEAAVSYDLDENKTVLNPFFFGKGISPLSNMDEVKEKWGECAYTEKNSPDIMLHYQQEPYFKEKKSNCEPYITNSSTNREIIVTFDRNNVNVIKEITLRFNEDLSGTQEFIYKNDSVINEKPNYDVKLTIPKKMVANKYHMSLNHENDYSFEIKGLNDSNISIFSETEDSFRNWHKDAEVLKDMDKCIMLTKYQENVDSKNYVIFVYDKKKSVSFIIDADLRWGDSNYKITDEIINLFKQNVIDIADTYELIEAN